MIERYHTLIRLGQLNDAINLLDGRIADALMRLGGYRYLAELARTVIENPDRLQKMIDEADPDDVENVLFLMGIGYQLAGDPVRAFDCYEMLSSVRDENAFCIAAKLLFQAIALDQLGCLAEAERCARTALAQFVFLDERNFFISIAVLGMALLCRGLWEEGSAWLGDYRAVIDDDYLGHLPSYELGSAAVRRGDVAGAQTFVHKLDSLASVDKRAVHLRVSAAVLKGTVSGQWGDEDRAGELLGTALVDARQVRLGELEIVALTQLAQWHLRGHRLPAARDHARDAVQLAERTRLRLRWADALNVLSRVERTAGDTDAAAQAARDAYHQAWCDGPPFSYAVGLDEARANLSAVGAPEPAGLADFQPGEPFPDLPIEPTPPSVLLAALRTGDAPDKDVVVAIEQLGWTAMDPAVAGELDTIFDSAAAPPIRAAALRALTRLESHYERRAKRFQRAVQDQAAEVRAAALSLLVVQGDDAVAAILRRITEQDDSEVPECVPDALVNVPDGIAWARPILLRAVETDPEGRVRGHVAELITGLEPRVHDALLRRRASEDDEPVVRQGLLMLLAGARRTWIWGWPYRSRTTVPRMAATIKLSAELTSFLRERVSSDLDGYVRTTARLLLAASHTELPPGVLLLDELVTAPASEHEPLFAALRAAGGPGRDPATIAKLSVLLESEESEAMRLELVRWLCHAEHPGAESTLRDLLRAAAAEVRRGALAVLGRDVDEPDRRLLTRDIDGMDPFLDPMEPITTPWIAQVAERIANSPDEVRRDYERLAVVFELGDWVRG
ncbi:MAG: hypothetical protein ACRDTC_10070 [Pseudonocardiaceae bacterium]